VAHPEARVAALLDVALRAAEAADQKVTQPLLGGGEIASRIHRAEDLVAGDLPVERRDEALEAVFADGGLHVLVVQCRRAQ